MENLTKIEIEGLKTIRKLCEFGFDRGMDGYSFTEIVERMLDELEATKANAVLECVWLEDLNEDMYGTWHTKCGNSFVLNEDSPAENQMKHCCYCGGLLVEAQEPTND